MSVWCKLIVAPKLPFTMNHEQFSALAREILTEDLVSMPCTLHVEGILYYQGEDGQSLLRTLQEVPYGQCSVGIQFDAFNWQNKAVQESFSRLGYYNAEVHLVAFSAPEPVVSYDLILGKVGEEYPVQYYFSSYGNGGPWDIAETPLAPVLKRHFGEDLIVECSYS